MHVTTPGHHAPLYTSSATPSSASSPRTTTIQNPVGGHIRTGSVLSWEPSSTVTNVLVAQCLKRRDQMLCFLLFSFLYIRCPLQGSNSSITHVRTGKFPYRGKAPSGLSHSFHYLSRRTSLLDLSHSSSFPTLRYSPICLPGPTPMAYL